jgi:hypothetical protein
MAEVYMVVSGDVPRDDTQENVMYSVIRSNDRRVVNTFSLPGRSNIPKFSISITIPSDSDVYEVGTFDDAGNFTPFNFRLAKTSLISVAAGAQGASS